MPVREGEGGGPEPVREADSTELTLTLSAPCWLRAPSPPTAAATARSPDGWTRAEGGAVGSPPAVPVPPGAPSDGAQCDAGSVLELVDRTTPVPDEPLEQALHAQLELGDFTAVLRATTRLLERDPGHAAARLLRDRAEARLLAMLHGRLRGGAVPVIDAGAADRHWLALDPRVAALLPWLDGVRTCAEVVAVSGLSELEGLHALSDLLEAQVVRLV
jgi:hypothetical protein